MGASSPAATACLWSGLLLRALFWPAASRGAEEVCPSSAWISFGSSCYALLQDPLETQSIDDARMFCKGNASEADIISINNREENAFIQRIFQTHWHGPEYIPLGMFFDTDAFWCHFLADDVFKWYDKSQVNFTNWEEADSREELLDTCATMHTSSGGWKRTVCEHLPLSAILCETAILYEKEYLLDAKVWTSFLVIASTIVVAVSAAFLWFLYQRSISSGTRCTAHSSSIQVPQSDEEFLVGEENEYTA